MIEMTGTKVGLYVTSEHGTHRVFKISRGKNGLITGSYHGQGPVRPLSHSVKDIHFTYPPNGQYHQTILFKDGRQLRVFFDRAEEKQSYSRSRFCRRLI